MNTIQASAPLISPHPTILYSSRMRHVDGGGMLLRTFSKVLEEREARLVVSGGADDLDRLSRYADTLGISPNVVFDPNTSQARLIELYRDADVFVHPVTMDLVKSRHFHEIAVLTALAFRLPVIACGMSRLLRRLARAEASLVLEESDSAALAQHVLRVLEDNELSDSLSDKGVEAVRGCGRRLGQLLSVEPHMVFS